MGNRINILPDDVLCHILSFVPTEEVVATSVLSKRWKPLWRSVPALDFTCWNYSSNDKARFRFVQSVSTFILSRDLNQPLKRFRIRCCSSVFDSAFFNAWLTTAAQSRVEHIDLCMDLKIIVLPSILLNCSTLVVLKLTCQEMSGFSSVHLPSLKILHLVVFLERTHLAAFLCGTPNLEDLVTKCVRFSHYETKGIFRRLPKLLRAVIVKDAVPLDVLYNVHFLRIEKMVM
uniref:F-box/LRR-repeat protein At5g41840 family n=2 Tax=Cajanus cajan TaxID=3821 RepID=A0A151RC50_CAJCA|nr:Putative F-box/LRR-repeat protein At5g41840 family [Cajanus cajan]KYP40108.1 Putative F-box/LRR-repeat protein At5g41840 family [Cajanus cajan]KYP40109.1 Putative F-box/LRR-repeat protein At5g41840 family [Cajanus cajan]